MFNLLEYILSSAFPPSSSMLMRFVKESGAKGCELLLLAGWISHLRRKQNHMKPLLSVMLSLWLLVFYSAAPVTFPAMAVNCFSGESPDEIYSGAFPQLVGTRSFQCTDLNSHRLLPSSSAPCPMNPFPKGMTSSALLWCEPCIRSGSCSSDLARFENLGLSAHDVQSPRAMELCLSLGNRSVAKSLPARSSLKSSRPCASSPLRTPPLDILHRFVTFGYHLNHLRSLSAADSVSSTSSPESSSYAVKLSPAGNRLLFLSNRVSRFTLGN
ncbi:hypothetical protein HID58_074054 [Brassica napus]|uniref:Uncharacterized protein n=1 Tax=Brassica napus TaxID=3708 RepID=A0ABQ7YFU1_BRANA|nr:hypothetical protein HID58_074054 [Brassica napus]